jgi:hypothetical protein
MDQQTSGWWCWLHKMCSHRSSKSEPRIAGRI